VVVDDWPVLPSGEQRLSHKGLTRQKKIKNDFAGK
jgi:hypothetical protein